MKDISFVGFLQLDNIKQPKYNIELLLKQKNDRYVRDILPLKIEEFEIRCLEWKDFKGKPIEDSEWIAHSYWGIFYNYQIIEEKKKILIRLQQQPQFQQNDEQKLMEQQSQNHPSNLKNDNLAILDKSQNNQQTQNLSLNLPFSKQNNQLVNLRLIPIVSKEKNTNVSKITRVSTQNSYSQKKEPRIGSNLRRSPTKLKVKLSVKCTFSEKSWAKSCINEYEDLLEHETGHYLIGCLCALEFKRQIEQLRFTKKENPSIQIKSIFQTIFRNFSKIEKDYDDETDHFEDTVKQKLWNHKIKEQLLLYEMYFCN